MSKSSLLTGILIIILLIFALSCVSRQYQVIENYYETAYRTEYKKETYSEMQNVVVNTTKDRAFLNPTVKWNDSLYFAELGATVPPTFYYGYGLYAGEHSRSQVEATLSPGVNDQRGYIVILDLASVGQIPPGPTYGWGFIGRATYGGWIAELNAKVRAARVIDRFWVGPNEIEKRDYIKFDAKGVSEFAIMVTSYYADPILSVEITWSDDVIQQRAVTKERQVPYQVPYQVQKQRAVMQIKNVPIWEVIFGK